MKSPVAGFLFLCLLSLAASAKLQSSSNSDPKLIADLCQDSDDKNFCISSLQNRPESVDVAATSNQIGVIALAVASAKASNTAAYIKVKLRSEDLEPAIEDTLEDCYKNYQDAGEQLDDSIAALLANAYTDVDVWVSAAISAAESCDGALQSRAGIDAELSRRNVIFLKLCKNALMINNKLT